MLVNKGKWITFIYDNEDGRSIIMMNVSIIIFLAQ